MHVRFFIVCLVGCFVLCRAKSGKTFITDERLHIFMSHNEHINPQVKLIPIKKQWLVQISLTYKRFVIKFELQIFQISEQHNIVTLCTQLRLDNESRIRMFSFVLVKQIFLLWKHKRWWNKINLIIRLILHGKGHHLCEDAFICQVFTINIPARILSFLHQ